MPEGEGEAEVNATRDEALRDDEQPRIELRHAAGHVVVDGPLEAKPPR